MYQLMPDLHIEIDEMIAEGDRVVCRNRWQHRKLRAGQAIEFHGFVE